MKKRLLFVLLLISSLSYSQSTYTTVSDLIDTNIADLSKITASKHRAVEKALLNYISDVGAIQYDIKMIKCDVAYLQANFETNGLGKNLRAGWAICNGSNGTDNLVGRVGIGYGSGYPLGGSGGSKDAVVVSHTHTYTGSNDDNGDAGDYIIVTPRGNIGTKSLTTTGVDGTDKNMQPYIVTLYIMKL